MKKKIDHQAYHSCGQDGGKRMNVLLFNGSTCKDGCTYMALSEIAKVLKEEGIESEILQMGASPVRECIGCNRCLDEGKCFFADDMVNDWLEKAKTADGFVFGSPVYFGHPTGQLLSVLDRFFYAGGSVFAHKPGAAIVTARRAGTTASLDVLNRYFAGAQMPVVPSTYWNMAFSPATEMLRWDDEGLQTMRNLGRNMAWQIKCIRLAEQNGITPPKSETRAWTNFNR